MAPPEIPPFVTLGLRHHDARAWHVALGAHRSRLGVAGAQEDVARRAATRHGARPGTAERAPFGQTPRLFSPRGLTLATSQPTRRPGPPNGITFPHGLMWSTRNSSFGPFSSTENIVAPCMPVKGRTLSTVKPFKYRSAYC